MKLGYARVSTDEQSLDVQLEQLKAAGVEHWALFFDKISGKSAERPGLKALLQHLTLGGGPFTVVVTKLDRLARNTRDLLEIIEQIGKHGAGFVSLGEPWADTTSPAGRMVMTVLAGVAEFERARILERTSEGRAYAKKNGVHMGRPAKLSKEQQRHALNMLKDHPLREVARVLKVNPKTIRRLREK